MGSSSSRSASFGHSHGSRRSHDSSTSPYDSIEDERTLYYAAGDQPPRWRRKHFLSANKSLAGRIAKHRKAVAVAAGAKGPAGAAPASSSSRMCRRRRRRSSQRRKASDSGRGSDECDCASGGDGGDRASSDEGDESLVSCRYCDEEEEEEEKKFVPLWSLRIEAKPIWDLDILYGVSRTCDIMSEQSSYRCSNF